MIAGLRKEIAVKKALYLLGVSTLMAMAFATIASAAERAQKQDDVIVITTLEPVR